MMGAMTAAWADAPAAARELTGTNAFRLMPADPLHEAPATATVRPAAGGHALVVTYTWEHADDGPQDGLLVVSSPDDEGVVHATLLDSWHQKPGPMQLTGRLLDAGLGASVAATYAEIFGWQIDVRLVGDGLELDMRNVVPAEAIPPEHAATMSAGPYDVMVLRVG